MTRLLVSVLVCIVVAACGRPLRAQTPTVRQTTLLWQVDGSESGDPFGQLGDYVLLKDGSVWALDFKDQLIRRFDARGNALRSVGREGAGPGEMRNANGLALAPDGSIWVNDPANARISVFSADGTVLRSISVPYQGHMYQWLAWFDRSGELVELEFGKEARYRRVDSNGKVLGTIALPHCPSGSKTPGETPTYSAGARDKAPSLYASYPFMRGLFPVADRRSRFWCVSIRSTRAALVPYNRTDTVARTTHEIPLITVDKAERDEAIQKIEVNLSKYQVNNFDRTKVPTLKSGIASLHTDDDGRLWIRHTSPWKQNRTTFDVFDASGKSLFRVSLPVRTASSSPLASRGDEFVLATVDEDDVVSLAKYRLR